MTKKEEKEDIMRKVFDTFVAKYGKLYNNIDATIVYDYIEREVNRRNIKTYAEIIDLADDAYNQINPKELSFGDVFKTMFDLFGDCCKTGHDDKDEKNSETAEKKTETPVCKCNSEIIKMKHKYVSDTNELKTVKYLLPGIQKNNISIDVVGDEIRVSLNDVVVESPFINPDFKDVIQIEEDMDLDNMKAKLDLGVLTLTIPKKVKIEEKRTIKIS